MTIVPAETPQLSPKRAYVETLLVFLAFFGSGVVGALFVLVHGQGSQGKPGWSGYVPASVDIVAQIGLAVAVVLLLLHRMGLGRRDIGLSLTRPDGTRLALGQSVRVLALAELAQVGGSVIMSQFGGKYPGLNASASYLFYMCTASVEAGVVEELVVLAFVVTVLRHARRPWWEVVTVALVLRVSYHVYYGVGALGVLVWGGVFLWLYVRTKNMPVLILAHASWDVCAFLSQRWPHVISWEIVCIAAVVLAAPMTYLFQSGRTGTVARAQPWSLGPAPPHRTPSCGTPAGQPSGVGPEEPSSLRSAWSRGPDGSPPPWPTREPARGGWPGPARPGNRAGPGGGPGDAGMSQALPSPAWYPDPSGQHRWRWWNGQGWTDHVHDNAT
jgi:membrane protease YdiL (CAAX protease family)